MLFLLLIIQLLLLTNASGALWDCSSRLVQQLHDSGKQNYGSVGNSRADRHRIKNGSTDTGWRTYRPTPGEESGRPTPGEERTDTWWRTDRHRVKNVSTEIGWRRVDRHRVKNGSTDTGWRTVRHLVKNESTDTGWRTDRHRVKNGPTPAEKHAFNHYTCHQSSFI